MPRCRKAETPSGSSATSRAVRETLPPDLLAAGVRRLGIVALLMASISVLFSVVIRFLAAHTGQAPYHGIVLFGEIAIVAGSLGMFALTRRAGLDPGELLDRALVYEVAMGFLMAAIDHSVPNAPEVLPKGWSSVAVWVIAFPLLIPSTRGKTTLATFATAAMDPLGLLVAVALGYVPLPAPAMAAAMLLPTAIACVMAIVGSRVVYRLSAQAGKAEELGSYRLVAPLGHGGMGEVWRAEHRMLARDAAIKLVRGRDGAIPRELVTRFEREAKATAGLRSPHTVQLYDFGRSDDGAFYYVMELLDGYTLDRLVERHGALAPERVVSVLRQACRSLAEAHGAGLVHRDIKPGNIFLCRYGGEADFVKVVDFGLVKDVSASGGVNLTQTGLIAGTPAYMPPEMALGKDVDGRADLYALGCVGYFLLTAQTVFDRKTALETLHDHTSTPPIPPSQRVATPIPADLEAVLLDCLAKEPADRPESARVLEERLAATSSAGRWSRADAERWWESHSPATGAHRLLPAEPEGTRFETPEVRAAAEG
ncbi:MAG TPA: serine/threonine-protein kinase [Thermoanaerobaculia bacterium]|jgi:serine/threonine-protein kinase